MSTKELFDIFVPSADASQAALARWRTLVGMTLFGVVNAIVCLYLITAKASELDEVKAAVTVPAMERIHARYCQSTNPETRHLLRQQVVRLQIQYKKATGIEYPLEDCEEVRRQADR